MEQKNQLNKTKIILIILFLIIILLLLILFLLNKKKGVNYLQDSSQIPKQKTTTYSEKKDEEITPESKTNLRPTKHKEAIKITLPPHLSETNIDPEKRKLIAENVVNWLVSLKEKDQGEILFSIGYMCNPGKDCEKGPNDRQLPILVAWSLYHYYLNTKKSEIIALVKEIINSYSDRPLQPDFWHCKLLYELRYPNNKEKIFTSEEEQKIDLICNKEILLRKFIMVPISLTKNYKNFDSVAIVEKIKNKNLILEKQSDLGPENSRDFLIYISHVSDLVTRSSWFSNPSEMLNLALSYLEYSLLFFQNQKEDSLNSLPYLSLAALDFYKKTGTQNFFYLFNYLFEESINNKEDNLFNLIGILFLLREKNNLTQNPLLLKQYEEILSNIIERGYDDQGYNGFRLGLKAFHSFGTSGYLYDTRNNALLVYLLLN